MAVPSPADADAATVRVRLVADMLQQKAREVQSKGNAGAAQSLSESAADLARAATLLQELARLVHLPPPRLRSDSDASLSSVTSNDGSTISTYSGSLSAPPTFRTGPPPANASVKDLVTKLSRVDAMLGKKSDEMKHKGNENAAHALLQSALAVRLAAQHIGEQQQLTRTLVVSARALREQLREHCRLLLSDDEEITDETTLDEERTRRALDTIQSLVAIRDVVRTVAPAATSADEMRDLFLHSVATPSQAPDTSLSPEDANTTDEEIQRLTSECTSLQQLLEETQTRHERELRDAHDDTAHIRTQCAALEKALEELEAEYHERRERELEHLNALHERQKGTHEELKKLLLAKEEEVSALKVQTDAWMNQLTQQQDTAAELQAQREQDHQFHDRQTGELREQLHSRDSELRTLRDEMRELQLQLDSRSSSVHEEDHRATTIAHLEAQLAEAERSLEGANVRVREGDARVAELEAALATREPATEVLAGEMATQELAAMREECVRLRTQLEETQAHHENELRITHDDMESVRTQCVALEQAVEQAREAERQAVLVSATEADKASRRTEEFEEQVTSLRQELEDERAKLVSLRDRHEQTKVELAAAEQEVALQRDETSTVESAQEALAQEQSARRVSELEAVLAQQHTRVEALVKELEAKDSLVVQLEAHVDAAQQARAAAQDELSSFSQQLQDKTSELVSVKEAHERARDELDAWKSKLLLTAQEMSPDDESLTDVALADHVITVVHQRSMQILTELNDAKRQYDTRTSSHAAELDELRATIEKLEAERILAQKQLETLQTSQPGSSEIDAVRKQLQEVETEFERYRTRSHAALKKVEKRAELLNSMRKENENLTRTLEEVQLAHDAAVEKEQIAVARLDEATRTLLMREEECAQQIEEAVSTRDEAEQKCVALEAANEHIQLQYTEATAKVSTLHKEKEELARTTHALHEQALELRDAALDEAKTRLEDARAALVQLEEKANGFDAQILGLETELRDLRVSRDDAVSRVAELEQSRDEIAAEVDKLTQALEQKTSELSALAVTREADQEKNDAAALAADKEREEATAVQASLAAESQGAIETELRAQLQSAMHDAEELTTRLMEVQLIKVAAEEEVELLRSQVTTLKAELAAQSTAIESRQAPADAANVAVLKESHDAKELQILRLLDEIEQVSKRQIEDQRHISDLKEKLASSEQRLAEAHDQLRRAADHESTTDTDTMSMLERVAAQEETITALRGRITELGASQQTRAGGEDDNMDETIESDDLTSLQARRQAKREQHEQEVEIATRKNAVDEYLAKTRDVVRELQESMDEYSSVFRDACALRDGETVDDVDNNNDHDNGDDGDDNTLNGGASTSGSGTGGGTAKEHEEYLTLKSGVVVKAGSTFSLPVYCDKPGCRVEWKFAVTEEGADVGFALLVETTTASDGTRTRETIVAPARVNDLSGVYDAPAGATGATTTLHFEWDNTFSWLNEKTLDYHVTVLEPLSETKKTLRAQEQALQAKVARVDERLALLRVEKQRREQLERALLHVEQCAEEKDAHLARFAQRRSAVQQSKAMLHARMDELKGQLSAFVSELDDLATGEREVTKAWDALQSEHEDVDMTMRLSANSQLDELMDKLQARKKRLELALETVAGELTSP